MKYILLGAVFAVCASCAVAPAYAGETLKLDVKYDVFTTPSFGLNVPVPEAVNVPRFHAQDPVEPPPPGSVWSASYLFRLTGDDDDRAAAGAQNRIRTFTNVFGRGWSLDLDVFAGFTLRRQTPVTAFLVGTRKKIANEVSFYFGAGVGVTQGQPSSIVGGAGVTIDF